MDRFWDKVWVKKDDECWIWSAYCNQDGYGKFGLKGKSEFAHRVAWELENNSTVPEGLEVRHSCDTPACVNPKHLLLGTHADNMRDRSDRGRMAKVIYSKRKITREDAYEIRRLGREKRLTGKQLAEMYNISISNACAIVAGTLWKEAS